MSLRVRQKIKRFFDGVKLCIYNLEKTAKVGAGAGVGANVGANVGAGVTGAGVGAVVGYGVVTSFM